MARPYMIKVKFGVLLSLMLGAACSTVTPEPPTASATEGVIHLANAEGLMGSVSGSTSVAIDLINGETPEGTRSGFRTPSSFVVEAGETTLLVTAAGDETYGSCEIKLQVEGNTLYQLTYIPAAYHQNDNAYILQIQDTSGQAIGECIADIRKRKRTYVPRSSL